ncbi:MAG: hypothetical protein AB8G18_15735 [Gammaproteobacteria bacterium]
MAKSQISSISAVDQLTSSSSGLTRRTFLSRSALCISAVVLGSSACTESSYCSAFKIDATMPGRLLFPTRAKKISEARLSDFACVVDINEVLLQFSNGQTLRWDRERSFASQVSQRGKVDLAAVAPKVVAAYALERLGQILRNSRSDIDVLISLKRDFDGFQRQSVLDAVTIGAVYDLAVALGADMQRVSRVTWNAEHLRFDLTSIESGDNP